MKGQNQREEGIFVFRDSVAEWVKSHLTEKFDNNRQVHTFNFWCWKNLEFKECEQENWQVEIPHQTYCDLVSCGGDPSEYVARQISKEIQKNS